MSKFRTSSVFRFTKEFSLLKQIIKSGIIPNYCEEDLSFGDTEFCIGIPMASFCDIPISLLGEHVVRYGKYGIALKKEWALSNGLTPIMYVANDEILRSVYHYHHINEVGLQDIDRRRPRICEIEGLVFRGIDIKTYIDLNNLEYEKSLNRNLVGYMKKYSGEYKGRKINNYEENEWRYIVPETKEVLWYWSRPEYLRWRFPDGIMNISKPKPSKILCDCKLCFDIDDVSYILVKNEEYRRKIIEYIREIKSIGGSLIKDDAEKDRLISRIVTIDQAERDF